MSGHYVVRHVDAGSHAELGYSLQRYTTPLGMWVIENEQGEWVADLGMPGVSYATRHADAWLGSSAPRKWYAASTKHGWIYTTDPERLVGVA